MHATVQKRIIDAITILICNDYFALSVPHRSKSSFSIYWPLINQQIYITYISYIQPPSISSTSTHKHITNPSYILRSPKQYTSGWTDGRRRLVCHDRSSDSPTDILTVKELQQKGFALTRAFMSLWPSDHENTKPETLNVVGVCVCMCVCGMQPRAFSPPNFDIVAIIMIAEDRVKVLRCRMAKNRSSD